MVHPQPKAVINPGLFSENLLRLQIVSLLRSINTRHWQPGIRFCPELPAQVWGKTMRKERLREVLSERLQELVRYG